MYLGRSTRYLYHMGHIFTYVAFCGIRSSGLKLHYMSWLQCCEVNYIHLLVQTTANKALEIFNLARGFIVLLGGQEENISSTLLSQIHSSWFDTICIAILNQLLVWIVVIVISLWEWLWILYWLRFSSKLLTIILFWKLIYMAVS